MEMITGSMVDRWGRSALVQFFAEPRYFDQQCFVFDRETIAGKRARNNSEENTKNLKQAHICVTAAKSEKLDSDYSRDDQCANFGWALKYASAAGLDLSKNGTGWQTIGLDYETTRQAAQDYVGRKIAKQYAHTTFGLWSHQFALPDFYPLLEKFAQVTGKKSAKLHEALRRDKDSLDAEIITSVMKDGGSSFANVARELFAELNPSATAKKAAFNALANDQQAGIFAGFADKQKPEVVITRTPAQIDAGNWTGKNFTGLKPVVYRYNMTSA